MLVLLVINAKRINEVDVIFDRSSVDEINSAASFFPDDDHDYADFERDLAQSFSESMEQIGRAHV